MVNSRVSLGRLLWDALSKGLVIRTMALAFLPPGCVIWVTHLTSLSLGALV